MPDKRRFPLTRFLFARWPYVMIRVGIGLVFLWSGLVKLGDPRAFSILIDAFGLIPGSFAFPAAVVIPIIEILIGAALVFDIRGGLSAAAGMLVFFMSVLSYGMAMGFDVDCGCFGPDDPASGLFHGLPGALFRDAVFAAGMVYLYLWRLKNAHVPAGPNTIMTTFTLRRKLKLC